MRFSAVVDGGELALRAVAARPAPRAPGAVLQRLAARGGGAPESLFGALENSSRKAAQAIPKERKVHEQCQLIFFLPACWNYLEIT